MATKSKIKSISNNADNAKEYLEKAIEVILCKYNQDWSKDQSQVDGTIMSDEDHMVYVYLKKAKEYNRNIRNECL